MEENYKSLRQKKKKKQPLNVPVTISVLQITPNVGALSRILLCSWILWVSNSDTAEREHDLWISSGKTKIAEGDLLSGPNYSGSVFTHRFGG